MAWFNQLNQVQSRKSLVVSYLNLLQGIAVKLIYQFLYLIYCFLSFRCREKGFEEKRSKNKDGNSRGVTRSYLPYTETGMMKILALTTYLLARITLTLMSPSAMPVVFKRSILRNLTYVLI